MLLQAISKCLTPFEIDMEVGSAAGELVGTNPLLTYVRYEVELQEQTLADLGVTVSRKQLESLREMSNGDNREQLFEIGQALAKRDVDEAHFPSRFAE